MSDAQVFAITGAIALFSRLAELDAADQDPE